MFKVNGVPVEIGRFPDGTHRLDVPVDAVEIILEWIYEKDEEFILYLIAKHLFEQCPYDSPYGKVILYMPYIPHARMDRVKDKQEVFTLKYFCGGGEPEGNIRKPFKG